MKLIIEIVIITCCLGIFLQDIRDRMISVLLFAIMGLFLTARFCLYSATTDNELILLSNFLFVVGQLGLLYVYFKFIRNSPKNFFNELFGLGDVLMMICMALVFPLPEYILYLLLSFMLGIMFAFVGHSLRKTATVPLAGIMAFVYIILTVSNLFFDYSPLILFTT
jgi:hypothetical protein